MSQPFRGLRKGLVSISKHGWDLAYSRYFGTTENKKRSVQPVAAPEAHVQETETNTGWQLLPQKRKWKVEACIQHSDLLGAAQGAGFCLAQLEVLTGPGMLWMPGSHWKKKTDWHAAASEDPHTVDRHQSKWEIISSWMKETNKSL